MEYISHEDFKGFMNKLQANTPKGMLQEIHKLEHDGANEFHKLSADLEGSGMNEDFERPDAKEMEEEDELGRITDVVYAVFAKDNRTSEKTVDSLAEDIRNEWSRTRGYGKGDEIDFTVNYLKDWVEEARSAGGGPGLGSGSNLSRGENNTIWGDDWESVIDNAAASLSEGNAFTAGLAKAKKGEKFKVDGKTVKDTSNYDASIKEADDEVDAKLTKIAGLYKGKAVKHEEIEKIVKALTGQGHEVNVRYVQEFLKNHDIELDEASYTDNYEGSWGYREGAEGETSDGSHMSNPDTVAKIVAKKHGAELKPLFDKYQASYDQYMQDIRAKKPNQQELAKAHNAIVKAFQNQAINWAGHEMLEAGMNKTKVDNLLSGYGYFEDWLSDYVSAVNKELKGVAEGLHMPPLQATGQTIVANEDQTNRFSVLSPEDRKQLGEYINHYKTIKQEIAKLLEKAGRSGKIMEDNRKEEDEKVPAERKAVYNNPTKKAKPGGNRTDLVMTKAEMWENEDQEHEYDTIEDSLGEKLRTTFHKVADLAIQKLMADGWDEDVAVSFLQRELEEKAREAMMSQYDL